MEKGFYHPSRGYWQTLVEPSPELYKSFPEGTIAVPLKPGSAFEWLNGKWVAAPPPPPTREEQQANRAAAFQSEADPIFFQYQRGEATEQEWLDKIEEIRARYPYPESEE